MYQKLYQLCRQVRDKAFSHAFEHEMSNAPWSFWAMLYHPVIETRLARLEYWLGEISHSPLAELAPPF